MLRFFYNGIKTSDGKLFKGWFSKNDNGVITFYAKEYGHAPKEIQDAFAVENDSDSQTDYFEKDRIRIKPNTKYYQAACEAIEKAEARWAKRRR